jgi:hypothetical protein
MSMAGLVEAVDHELHGFSFLLALSGGSRNSVARLAQSAPWLQAAARKRIDGAKSGPVQGISGIAGRFAL